MTERRARAVVVPLQIWLVDLGSDTYDVHKSRWNFLASSLVRDLRSEHQQNLGNLCGRHMCMVPFGNKDTGFGILIILHAKKPRDIAALLLSSRAF